MDRIQIISDLHLDASKIYNTYKIVQKAPLLALLGDTGCTTDPGLFDFIRDQLNKFRIVFYLYGNHEPFHSSWAESKATMQRFVEEVDTVASQPGNSMGKLIILDQARHDISPTTTLLGCTLFSYIRPEQDERVSSTSKDFDCIDGWTTELHNEAHMSDLTWLNDQVASISRDEPDRRIIVMTHYCPTMNENVVDPRHKDSRVSSGFMTDLSNESCWRSNSVKTWIYGHTHYNCDYRDPDTGKRVVSNQRGYDRAQAAGFDDGWTLEL